MTKQMEEALNLPSLKEALKNVETQETALDELAEQIEEDITVDTKAIDEGLISEKSLEEHDAEMDHIYDKAMESYDDLLTLGLNSEPRIAGQIIDPAVQLLKVALDAKNSKVDKKIRLMQMRLNAKRLQLQAGENEGATAISGNVFDREELLKLIKSSNAK